jgi:glycosyltransferase involved in cell wall biosynthesis
MRIVIVAGPTFPIPAIRGGAMARIWEGLAEELARLGHRVCVFARAFAEMPSFEDRAGVHYIRWGGYDQTRHIYCDLMKDLFNSIGTVARLPAADVVVTNSAMLPVVASLFGRGSQIVVNANRFPKRHFQLYSRVRHIAAASQAVRNAILQQFPGLTGKVTTIPNPVDTAAFVPAQSSSTFSSAPSVLFVGRVHPEKGVDLLIRSFLGMQESVPEWRLKIVGPWQENQGGGGEQFVRSLRQLIGTAPVEISGPVFDVPSLVQEYQRSSLFCYPSVAERGEAFGVAPVEAMACGVPVILSKLECFLDFFQNEVHGWSFNHRAVEPERELTQALKTAVSSQNLTQLGLACRSQAMQFSYSCVAKSYEHLFERILGAGDKKDTMS